MTLYQEWMNAKAEEAKAIQTRRYIEDKLLLQLNLDTTQDKSKTIKQEGYKIGVTTRLSHSIDADALQEIAAENGSSEHLATLFTWKPALKKSVWNATDKSITDPLLAAITTKPGRPTFKITKEDN